MLHQVKYNILVSSNIQLRPSPSNNCRRTHHRSITLRTHLTAALQLHRKRRHRPVVGPGLRRILEDEVPQPSQSGDGGGHGPQQHPHIRLALLHRREEGEGAFPVRRSPSHRHHRGGHRAAVRVAGEVFQAVREVDGENGRDRGAGRRCRGDQKGLPRD